MKKRCTVEEAIREVVLQEVDAVYLMYDRKLFGQWLDASSWATERYEFTNAVSISDGVALFEQVLANLVKTNQIKKFTIKVPGRFQPGTFYVAANAEIITDGQ